MRVLITGASGFSAKHLVPILSTRDSLQLIFSDKHGNNAENWFPCDLTDFDSVFSIIAKIKPAQIYHLAGCFSNNYEDDYEANVLSTKNILDSIVKLKHECRVLLVGSSAEYGNVSESDNPVKEDHPLNPVSIYGLTKVYQTHLMKFYTTIHNMDIVMARTFNLFGNGISNKLFIGHLYEQIAEYKKRNIPKIILGNLRNKRDYIKIDDAVRYYEIIMNYGVSGEIYNVGSGRSIRIYDLLQGILKENKLSMDIVEEKIGQDINKIDISDIYADITRISLLSREHLK